MSSLASWLREFVPGRMAVDARERLRAAGGALVGLLLAGFVCQALLPAGSTLPWLVAPLGASAVLVFAVPASPLAQPWSVFGGNTLSALIGIFCVMAFGQAPWVAALAVALAIAAMFLLRCLHPPGGASALLMVLAGVHEPAFAAFPVALNSLLLTVGGIAYNHATGRRYPHGQQRQAAAPQVAQDSFSEADLDAVLRRYNQVLDVPRDDLANLLRAAELQSHQRRLGALRCADVMSKDLATVEFGSSLEEAWALLRQRRIKALPVIDRARHVVGIVTLADFMRSAELDLHAGWADRLRALIRNTPGDYSDKAEVVGQIMSRQVRVASAERPLADLVPLFATTGHHHIPIIDGQQRLVGIVTQSDLVAALR
jgi:CBS domain-containing membrane protein